MPIIHFLNVNDGDCSIIEHISEHVTVIDVCNAKKPRPLTEQRLKVMAANEKGVNGNFNQKAYPVNPISYMQEHGYKSVFRFILTHPDMDHMDGLKAFFETFHPINFWDTNNDKETEFEEGQGKYSEEDWNFYTVLRDAPTGTPTRLTLYSGQKNKYFNQDKHGNSGGDGLYILAPTPALLKQGNESGEYNDCSYVILYKTSNHRILFAGDSHDNTWEHILTKHRADVTDADLLIAPHHGRDSERDWEFLDVANPALTLFGNAPSKDLAYPAWNKRGLRFITNNQAGCVIVNAGVDPMDVYVTCKAFAKASNPYNPVYSEALKAYYWGEIKRAKGAKVAGI